MGPTVTPYQRARYFAQQTKPGDGYILGEHPRTDGVKLGSPLPDDQDELAAARGIWHALLLSLAVGALAWALIHFA